VYNFDSPLCYVINDHSMLYDHFWYTTFFPLYSGWNPFIHRSTDGGQTWQPISTVSHVPYGEIVIAADGQRMYIAGSNAMDISDDGGETWRGCLENVTRLSNPPAIALHPQDNDTLLLGQWGVGIVKTSDACASWRTIDRGLDNLFINTLAFAPDVVYAGTDGGVFVSMDGGESWRPASEGLGAHAVVYSIVVDPNDASSVYAATPDGIFRLANGPASK